MSLNTDAETLVRWVEAWLNNRNGGTIGDSTGSLSIGSTVLRKPDAENLAAGNPGWDFTVYATRGVLPLLPSGAEQAYFEDDVLGVAVVPLAPGRCELQFGWRFPEYLGRLITVFKDEVARYWPEAGSFEPPVIPGTAEELRRDYRRLFAIHVAKELRRPNQTELADFVVCSTSTLKRKLRLLGLNWKRDFSTLTPSEWPFRETDLI